MSAIVVFLIVGIVFQAILGAYTFFRSMHDHREMVRIDEDCTAANRDFAVAQAKLDLCEAELAEVQKLLDASEMRASCAEDAVVELRAATVKADAEIKALREQKTQQDAIWAASLPWPGSTVSRPSFSTWPTTTTWANPNVAGQSGMPF